MKRLIFAVMVFIAAAGIAAAQNSVTLSVKDRAGLNRNEYVSFGVPVPREWNVTNVSAFRIIDSSAAPIPAQFEALARWGGAADNTSAPIKWVLVGFFASVSANSTQTVQLDNAGNNPLPSQSIQINSSSGKMTVNTGAAQFELNTTGSFNIFNQVTIGGKSFLQPLDATAAINAKLSIVSGGTPNSTPRITSAAVERQGSLYSVVKIMGSILDATSKPMLDYTARLHFYAGTSDVRIDFTLENNHPVIEDGGGQPANAHSQGAINSVYIDTLKLALQPASAGTLRILTEQGSDVSSPSSNVRLYQDSSGTDYWNVYKGLVGWPGEEKSAEPRLQSYCAARGFSITGPGISKTGDQALGWMSVARGTDVGIVVAVRDFWQNFPKAIETSTNGIISVDLFPNGSQFHHNFRVGEEKTHTIFYHFGASSPTEAERMAKAFNAPLFGTAPASWYISTGVLGQVPEANSSAWQLYENYVRVAFTPNPAYSGDFENITLLTAIQKFNFYGWQDYGDVPLDYEAFGDHQAGQMNLKYWYVYGMLTQFCRSADMQWIDLAIPAARHLSDIDYLHIPDTGIAHWSHGAYFGHSQHDEPGCTNPNRNYNSPSVDLFFGVPDLFLAYYLFGETRFLDVAKEGLQAMENLSQFSNFSYPVFYRERANLIFAYIEGYRYTGESRWLNDLHAIIQPTADLSNKGWLNNPRSYIPPEGGSGGDERISGFALGQVLWTMGRYLDCASEYKMTDTFGVATALGAYGDFIINHMMYEIPAWYRQNSPGEISEETLQSYAGHYATIDSIWFTAPYGTYLEINAWALLLADSLSYAYKYTGQKRYLDAAGLLYTTGTLDQVWIDDPPVYMASKDLVNVMNWGLVYMNTTSSTSAGRLAADFGSYGLYIYDGTNWTWIAGNPEGIAAWGNSLAADFGAYGIYLFDGANWRYIGGDSQDMAAWGNFLAADFGAYGIYLFDGANWRYIAGDSQDMTAWGNYLAADFGAYGIYLYDGNNWRYIGGDSQDMAAWGNYLAADFGAYGIYLYDGNNWRWIAGDSEDIAGWGNFLAADFGAYGIYLYEPLNEYKPNSWRWIAGDSQKIIGFGNYLAADFGVHGLYLFDGNNWSRIAGDPEDIEALK